MHPNMVFTEFVGGDIVNSVNGEIVYQKRLDEKMILLNHFAKTKIGINIRTSIRTENADYIVGQTYRNGEKWSTFKDDIIVSVNKKYLPVNQLDKKSKLDDLQSLCHLLGITCHLLLWESLVMTASTVTIGNTTIPEDDYMKLFYIPVKKYIVKVPSPPKKDPTEKLQWYPPALKRNKKFTWFDKLMQVFN
jgi:hypothetical protein